MSGFLFLVIQKKLNNFQNHMTRERCIEEPIYHWITVTVKICTSLERVYFNLLPLRQEHCIID